MTDVCIHAIGCANPPTRLSREQWIEMAVGIAPESVERATITRLAERSDIDGRWCASAPRAGESDFFQRDSAHHDDHDDHDHGPGTARRMQLWSSAARQMSLDACTQAIERAGIAPQQITHLITASCTGFEAPGLDAWIINNLALSPECRKTNVGFMGCHAAINALAIARDIVIANPSALAMVCCAEVSSAHLHYSDRVDQLIANTIFADGASAVVVGRADPKQTSIKPPRIAATHSIIMPASADAMSWTIGDHGFEMSLGARVPQIIQDQLGPWVRRSLAQHGMSIADVCGWAIHPGGPRVIEAVLDSLALPRASADASRRILREFGNMSSATLLFIMQDLMQREAPRPWVGLAFGPGIAGEMVVVV